jgi:hypothetical protein
MFRTQHSRNDEVSLSHYQHQPGQRSHQYGSPLHPDNATTTTHPRTLARRCLLRPFDIIIIIQGIIYKVPKHWSKSGPPTMPPPTRATIGDILDAAAIKGERPRDLLDRLRGSDRQWQLDHR